MMLTERDRMVLRFLEQHRNAGDEWVLPRQLCGACEEAYRDHPTLIKRRYSRGPVGMIQLYAITDEGRKIMRFD